MLGQAHLIVALILEIFLTLEGAVAIFELVDQAIALLCAGEVRLVICAHSVATLPRLS